MSEKSLIRHQADAHRTGHKWIRRTALLLAVVLALTAVMDRVVYVSADLADFGSDSEAAAGGHLLKNNDYIRQTWLERAGIVTAAALSPPTTFEDYYRLAEISISKNDFSTALTQVEKSLTLIEPADAADVSDVWLVKGSLETLLDRDETALQSLAEAIRLDPEQGDAYLVQSQIFIEKKDWNQALDALNLYFDRIPAIDTRMYAVMGELHLALNHYQEAADHYSLSIRKYNAVDPDIYLRRGGCYVQTGAFAEAAADFSKAAELGADQVICSENLVLCHLILQDYSAVLDAGYMAASETLASAELLQNMGIASMALTQMDKALDYFDRSITMNADLNSSFYYRGICRLSLEQYEEATQDFSTSINRGEALQLSYYNRGVCYLNRELYDQAKADMELSVSTGGDPLIIQSARAVLQQMEDSNTLINHNLTVTMPAMFIE